MYTVNSIHNTIITQHEKLYNVNWKTKVIRARIRETKLFNCL